MANLARGSWFCVHRDPLFFGANRKELDKIDVAQDKFVRTCHLPLLDLLQEGECSERRSKNAECGAEETKSFEIQGIVVDIDARDENSIQRLTTNS